ncbi:MAG: hypothetical protein L0Z50_20450 [Verrucomicrobiales bacterium]|nr:hypothetical protein [Verrucomicrobiales bacterium]
MNISPKHHSSHNTASATNDGKPAQDRNGGSSRNWLPAGVMLTMLMIMQGTPALAKVVPMSNEEVIQRSKLIFVGTVLEKTARWNDKGNLIVTDYRFEVEDVLHGTADAELVLTFAGGQLPEEGQAVSDVPEFSVADHLLLMIEDSKTPLLSPVTGMHQGIMPDAANPNRWSIIQPNGARAPFGAVVEVLRAQIPAIKSRPFPDRRVPAFLQGAVLKDLPSKVYDPTDTAQAALENAFPPQRDPGAGADIPAAPNQPIPITGQVDPPGYGDAAMYWSYSHRAKNVPIVFNPLPSGGLIGDHDQFQMSYWNDYGDIYRVIASTGTWAWGNDRYDIAGFVNEATMVAQFGSGWGASTLAVCWLRWDGTGFSIEADIAMNPAFSWTTDDYSTYNNVNLHNADHTLLHEIGHSWGLEHQFNALSVMNYAPHKYRAYNVLYGDDTMAIRAAFPGNAIARTDLGVSLFFSNGFQDFDDSDLSSTTVPRGSSFTVSNFVLENPGTVTVADPTLDWYLVPTINSWSGNIYIGTTTHASLAGDTFFLTSRTLTVPSFTPIGSYYLGAFVANGSDSIGDNNSSWLDRLISVTCPSQSAPTGVTATDGTYCDRVRVSWTAPSGATEYLVYRGGSAISSWISGTSYDDFTAGSGVYSYQVRARNSCLTQSGLSSSDNGSRCPVVTVTATDATAGEAGTGEGAGTLRFSRTGSTTSGLTANYTVGGTAGSGTDYNSIGTMVAFAAGSATADKTVNVIEDTLVEVDETVIVSLGAGGGYTVGTPNSATVTIKNDDLPVVTVTATDPVAGEPGSGQEKGKFTFSRTGPTTAALTANYTVGGSAASGPDYTPIGTTVTFAAGSATKTKNVIVADDSDVEPNETVEVTLAAGSGYSVGSPSAATVTIEDDDVPSAVVTVAATDSIAGEPGSGQDKGKFTFSRTGPTTAALTVNYSVGGSAASGPDYTPIGTTVTFAAGAATKIKNVIVADDGDVESDETVVVTLAAGSGYSVGSPGAATVTIQDDDAPAATIVTVTASDPMAGEPGSGQEKGKFTFSRTGSTAAELTVTYTVGGSAASGPDYTPIGTTVTFAAGSATKNKTVIVADDTDVEPNETVRVTLAAGGGYSVGSPSSATVTIQDDD